MELMIPLKIQKYRKSLGMTQDELSAALGVSPQAVSNWERGTCYPDITILPGLANLFGITIDELMDNDALGRKADWERYKQLYTACKTDEEVIRLTLGYYRKYPNDPLYMTPLSGSLTSFIAENPAQRKEYFPLLREISKKMLSDPPSRNAAVRNMAAVCENDELSEWLELCPHSAMYTRRNTLKFRYLLRGEQENYRIQQAMETLELFSAVLDRRIEDSVGPVQKAEFHRTLLGMMDVLRTDGKLPDGWILFYAYKELVLSACLFASGGKENMEAWEMFTHAMEHFRYWFGLKEDYLELGNFGLFAGLKVSKDWRHVQTNEGISCRIYDTTGMCGYTPEKLYSFLTDTCPQTAWFDPVRNDPRFTDAVKQIRTFQEKEEPDGI